MNLRQIEDQIRSCQRLESTAPREAIESLYSAWAALRRTAWNPDRKAIVGKLSEECRIMLERLSEGHALAYAGEPDRFPGYVDSAGQIHRAIH